MGVGSITSMNSMSGMWKTTSGSVDAKSKTIQNEITGIQQQMQKISSKEELSANEKANERKNQQKQIVNLNMELKRHQDEFLKSRKRELMMAELQGNSKPINEEKPIGGIYAEDTVKNGIAEQETQTADTNIAADAIREKMPAVTLADTPAQQTGQPGTVIFKSNDGSVILKENLIQNERSNADTNNKQADETKKDGTNEKKANSLEDEKNADTGLSRKEIYTMVSKDASAQQTSRRETVIARIESGIAVLKGEIAQDEKRGVNTDKKQAELEKLEQKEERARSLQFSVLNKKEDAAKSPTKVNVSGIQGNAENDVVLNASKLPKAEGFASQQRFYVSLGN